MEEGIARNVCSGNSLSVAAPSLKRKVKKCWKGLWAPVILPRANSFLGGNQRDSERIETAVLLKNLHERQQLHSQPMAV